MGRFMICFFFANIFLLVGLFIVGVSCKMPYMKFQADLTSSGSFHSILHLLLVLGVRFLHIGSARMATRYGTAQQAL